MTTSMVMMSAALTKRSSESMQMPKMVKFAKMRVP